MKSSRDVKKGSGAGCLILFGIPFAGVGLFMTYLTASTILTWFEMRQWVEAPAVILDAELETDGDSDGTTFRAEARYCYNFGGREYIGTRVSIEGGADNVGSFQQDAYHELLEHKETGAPFRCFVNPKDPSQAVLYRRLRPEMLLFFSVFAVVFGGAGLGVIFLGVYGWKASRNEARLRNLHPERPWLWKQTWADGTIKSSTRTGAIVAASFAGLWNAISFPLAIFIIPQALRDGEYAALLILLFPAVGLLLAAWAVVAALRWRRYGVSVFQMTKVPGVIGGPLEGVIYTNVHIRPEEGFKLTLNCINRRVTGSGKNRNTRETVLWEDSRLLQRELLEKDTTRSAIPVLFSIPFDCQQTNEENPNDSIFWRLDAEAAVPGVDYSARFEVPVFKTPESRDDFVADETPIAAYEAPFDFDKELRSLGIQRTPLVSGGLRYDFPRARLKSTAALMTVFFVIWMAAITAMIAAGAPIVMTAIFCIFGVLIGWYVIDLWFGSQRIEADFQVLTLTSSTFGFRKRKTLYFADIAGIEVSSGMQAGNKEYYMIEVRTTDVKTCQAAKHIPGRKHAEAIAADLQKALAGE